MTKLIVMVVVAMSMVGCASVQARKEDGKRYTCYPNSAMDRGPFQPATPEGEKLTVYSPNKK